MRVKAIGWSITHSLGVEASSIAEAVHSSIYTPDWTWIPFISMAGPLVLTSTSAKVGKFNK